MLRVDAVQGAVIPLVDVVEPSAAAIESVNTIVNDDGVLTASNTDYEAIAQLIAEHALDPAQRVLVRGSGGMAKAVVAAFRGAGFDDLSVLARNAAPARRWPRGTATPGSPPTPSPAPTSSSTSPRSACRGGCLGARVLAGVHRAATSVFDVVAFPAETPLIIAARAAGKPVISGAEALAMQAAAPVRALHGRAPHPRADRARFGLLTGRAQAR